MFWTDAWSGCESIKFQVPCTFAEVSRARTEDGPDPAGQCPRKVFSTAQSLPMPNCGTSSECLAPSRPARTVPWRVSVHSKPTVHPRLIAAQSNQRPRQCVRVIRWCEKAFFTVPDDLGDATHIGCENRRPRCHRLHHSKTKCLLNRRHDENVRKRPQFGWFVR